jgi:hypothetical protein
MKNSIKSQFKNICALAILIFTISTTKVEAQANYCNNDTIYFDNQVDCPICITVECYDPNSGSTNIINSVTITNNKPLMSLPSNCPDLCPSSSGFISCGGPAGPQTGKIILPPNTCELCPALKFNLIQVFNSAPIPPISIFSSYGQSSALITNSICCPQTVSPNLEFSFDCTAKTLYLKCTQ